MKYVKYMFLKNSEYRKNWKRKGKRGIGEII